MFWPSPTVLGLVNNLPALQKSPKQQRKVKKHGSRLTERVMEQVHAGE